MIENLKKLTVKKDVESGYIILKSVHKYSYYILWTSLEVGDTEKLRIAKKIIKNDFKNSKKPWEIDVKIKLFEAQFSNNRLAVRGISRCRQSNRVYKRFNPSFYICSECKELHNKQDLKLVDGTYFCITCFNKFFQHCSDCNTIMKRTEAIQENQNVYCVRCWTVRFFNCGRCGDTFNREDGAIGISGDRMYCQNCFDDTFRECDNCGETRYVEDMEFDGDYYYCRSCQEDNATIKNYMYKPSPVFQKENYENTLYMGFELEVEKKDEKYETSNNELAEELQNFLDQREIGNRFYFKQDGSVNDGFEVVSHPTTWKAYHKRHKLREILNHLKDGFTSHRKGTCGLHFHINKSFFKNDKEINKLLVFFNNSKGQLKKFSKRSDRHIDNFCRFDGFDMKAYKYYWKGDFSYCHEDERHVAVNLLNRKTVEIRLFRGTLNYERFLANLQFVDAVCHFIKLVSVMGLSWDNFMKYLRLTNRYNHLEKFLQKEDITCV